MVVHFIYFINYYAWLTNTKAKIDDSDMEEVEVDEMNVIDNDSDVDSDIDVDD